MKVKELMEELSKVNPNFNVMISVGRKGERDLIEKVRTAECPNQSRFPDFGWVELVSCNPIDWHYLTNEDCKMKNWIKCSDNLPDMYTAVLGTTKNGDDVVKVMRTETFLNNVGWEWVLVDDNEGYYFQPGLITAWMPLPERYKESEDKE